MRRKGILLAGSLLAVRNSGTRRAVLFAEAPAAIRSYLALGFRPAGDYGLILFEKESA